MEGIQFKVEVSRHGNPRICLQVPVDLNPSGSLITVITALRLLAGLGYQAPGRNEANCGRMMRAVGEWMESGWSIGPEIDNRVLPLALGCFGKVSGFSGT